MGDGSRRHHHPHHPRRGERVGKSREVMPLDISALGLATLDFIILGLPSLASGAASTLVFFPLVRSEGLLPLRTTQFGGGSLIKIQAFTTTSAEASGDLDAYIIPFIAFGT